MRSPADNFSRVERLNHFISVFRDKKREGGGNVEPGKEPELTLLLFKRDTFKAVIMTKKEYN